MGREYQRVFETRSSKTDRVPSLYRNTAFILSIASRLLDWPQKIASPPSIRIQILLRSADSWLIRPIWRN